MGHREEGRLAGIGTAQGAERIFHAPDLRVGQRDDDVARVERARVGSDPSSR